MTSTDERSCYNCRDYALCRLRDRARELGGYFNVTGNLMGDEFSGKLYDLMGVNCSEYKKEEHDTDAINK